MDTTYIRTIYYILQIYVLHTLHIYIYIYFYICIDIYIYIFPSGRQEGIESLLSPVVLRSQCLPDVSLGSRLWLVFPSPQRRLTGGYRIIALACGAEIKIESLLWPVVLRFQCSPDVCLRISALANISEPRREPTGGYGIIGLACGAAI